MYRCQRCDVEFRDGVQCTACQGRFDFGCAGITETGYRKLGDRRNAWRCAACKGSSASSPLNVPVGKTSVAKSPTPSDMDSIALDLKRLSVQVSSLPSLVASVKSIQSDIAELKTMKKDITELKQMKPDIADLKTSMEFVQQSMDALTGRVTVIDQQVQGLLKTKEEVTCLQQQLEQLRGAMREQDQRSRMNNLEIKGVPIANNEDLYTVVSQIGELIKCPIPKQHINYIARVPMRNDKTNKSIVVCVHNRYLKDDFVAAAKKRTITPADLGLQGSDDEDEESLGRSLIKISKKELNDLVTELFNIIPETEETGLTQNMSNSVLTNNSQSEITQRDVKQEPLSDEENGDQPSKKLTFEKSSYSRVSMGKHETENDYESQCNGQGGENTHSKGVSNEMKENPKIATPMLTIRTKNRNIEISIEERNPVQPSLLEEAPPSLRNKIKPVTETVCIKVDSSAVTMTPEQILILQQQLRQHIQLATSNFLQLFVHPVHWKLAPTYKDYLTSLMNIVEKNDKSIVNVCNLQPAQELVATWEASVSADTEENRKMIEFVQSEVARSRRRMSSNCLYAGNFHETFKNVICNSPVFLYPYLLPSMPYRPDVIRRYSYLHSEDTLIVLGMDQFWSYVDSNPQLFKLRTLNPRIRRGLSNTMELVAKHMFPWMNPRTLSGHVQAVRSQGDEHNPIYRYFKYNEMPKIEHRILPFNPSISLYEQPEHEMPKIWVRYLAKTSKRFRNYIYKRHTITGRPPEGVPINPGITPDETVRKPLPIDFTKQIICHRATLHTKPQPTELTNRLDIDVQTPDHNNTTDSTQNHILVAQNFFKLVETSTGAFLVPLQVNTQTVNSNIGPITTPAEVSSTIIANNLPETRPKRPTHKDHCSCCVLLRSICKEKQMLITHYFKSKNLVKKCDCSDIKFLKVSNRLRLLARNHKKASELVFKELERILKNGGTDEKTEIQDCNIKDMMYVLSYQLKLFTRASMSKRISVKQRVNSLLSRFDVEHGDPVTLATALFKTFDVELVDLYLDFLPFLTPDQADRLDMFKDYFTRNCSKDLMERVAELVNDKEVRHKILTQLKSVFSDGKSSSCDICSGLLETMAEYPTLARYTFNLFPHRKENRTQVCDAVETGSCTQGEGEKDANDTEYEEPHHTVDYEADHSSFGEDSDAMSVDLEEPLVEESQDFDTPMKMENLAEDLLEESEETITKTEAEEFDTSISLLISEKIKSEQEMTEWKREDDKIVLELLKEYLSPDERQGRTIQENLELLEEKNVYELLSAGLTDKSLSEIRERVLVLLSVVLSVDTVCTK